MSSTRPSSLRTSRALVPTYAAASASSASGILGQVDLPLPQFGDTRLLELWPAGSEPERGETAGITWASDREHLFGHIAATEDGFIEDVSRDVYHRVIAFAREAGFPFFLRIWNHVASINEVERGMERYQRFCSGRHDAFAQAGYHLSTDLPAASAVGMRGSGLVTYFLAARESGRQIENPRQMAAYEYPPRYGPRSPSFSRATIAGDVLFISGTASVVGHETVHHGDVEAQLDETLRNLQLVVERGLDGGSLDDIVAAKTYIRHRADFAVIEGRLRSVFPNNLYVEADICRADLLLEIEGVATRG